MEVCDTTFFLYFSYCSNFWFFEQFQFSLWNIPLSKSFDEQVLVAFSDNTPRSINNSMFFKKPIKFLLGMFCEENNGGFGRVFCKRGKTSCSKDRTFSANRILLSCGKVFFSQIIIGLFSTKTLYICRYDYE